MIQVIITSVITFAISYWALIILDYYATPPHGRRVEIHKRAYLWYCSRFRIMSKHQIEKLQKYAHHYIEPMRNVHGQKCRSIYRVMDTEGWTIRCSEEIIWKHKEGIY